MDKNIIKKLPKVELHCHLDGSVRPSVIREIAKSQDFLLPESDEALNKLLTVPDDCDSLYNYLRCFDLIVDLLQTSEAIEKATYDLIKQAEEENVRYVEIRFSPIFFISKGLITITEAINAVLEGAKKGLADFGVYSGILLCGMRHHSAEQNEAIVEYIHSNLDCNIMPIGFDLAGDESKFPPRLFETAFKKAKEYNIPITIHAGECGSADNIRQSIELGATRIGHGIAMKDDTDVQDLCKEKNVLIEMCYTSNLQTKAITKAEEFPIMDYLKKEIPLCLNTDSRTVSNTTLTDEVMKLNKLFGFSYKDLYKTTCDAILHSFASEEVKQKILREIDQAYSDFI